MENLSLNTFLKVQDGSALKRVEYKWGHGSKGEVAYQIKDKKIIFTATRSSRETPSTVNAAENVVMAICQQEGIDWRSATFSTEYEFYDLSTPIGYPGRKDNPFIGLSENLGEVQIDKLEIERDGNSIFVKSWTPVHLQNQEIKKE